MRLTLNARALIAVALGASLVLPLTASAADSGRSPSIGEAGDAVAARSIAEFEGAQLDLRTGWGDATACWVREDASVTCYRTEAALDAAVARERGVLIDQPTPSTLGDGFARANGFRAATCSVSAKLYKGSWYSYSVLYISTRYMWLNMSWYGFDNSVSSYKIGACSTTFRSGSYGGGSTYGGGTYAWRWRSSMGSWDNVLSSVYIY